ncbi:MAG: hypothetical protein AAF823_05040 [Planctomycetota bacterium]
MAEITYISVDLEIESRSDLTPLLDELSDEITVMYRGDGPRGGVASFQLPVDAEDPETDLSRLCSLIENLTEDSRRLWDEAMSRTFDLGYLSGTTPRNLRTLVQASTMERIAHLGGTFAITIYPPSDDPLEDLEDATKPHGPGIG